MKGCGYFHGLDLSESMVAACCGKLQAAGLAATKAQGEGQDITNFALDQRKDNQ